jgi:hypothetical protein
MSPFFSGKKLSFLEGCGDCRRGWERAPVFDYLSGTVMGFIIQGSREHSFQDTQILKKALDLRAGRGYLDSLERLWESVEGQRLSLDLCWNLSQR